MPWAWVEGAGWSMERQWGTQEAFSGPPTCQVQAAERRAGLKLVDHWGAGAQAAVHHVNDCAARGRRVHKTERAGGLRLRPTMRLHGACSSATSCADGSGLQPPNGSPRPDALTAAAAGVDFTAHNGSKVAVLRKQRQAFRILRSSSGRRSIRASCVLAQLGRYGTGLPSPPPKHFPSCGTHVWVCLDRQRVGRKHGWHLLALQLRIA